MRGREMIKKKSNRKKYQEILIKSSICIVIVLLSLYYIFPIFLNYPKNILEEEFQKKIMGITYNTQYIIFSVFMYLIIFVSLLVAYKSTKIVEGDNREKIIVKRKRAFNYPHIILRYNIFCTCNYSYNIININGTRNTYDIYNNVNNISCIIIDGNNNIYDI